MEVLVFPVAGRRYAVEARRVERVETTAETADPVSDLEVDVTERLTGEGPAAAARVILRAGDRTLALRTGLPEGFCEVEPSQLIPLPGYLFDDARRVVRAVFEGEGGPCLLLDERALAPRIDGPCS